MQILEIFPRDKILIIAPHPDDECIGPGGILCLYPSQCSVLVISDGREGIGDILPEIGKEIRKAEFIEEMRLLGISDYRMLEYKDGTLLQHTDCLQDIDLSVYTKIFVTGSHDNHPDHTAAYISLCQAFHKQQIRNVEIYLYEIHAPLRNATHLLDITSVIDKKQQLISFHQSQNKRMPYDRYARCMAEYRALQNRMPEQYIEVYTLASLDDKSVGDAAELENRLQKSNLFYLVLTRWVEFKINGHHLAEILAEKGYYKIAVYGYAELGKLFCQELLYTKINVIYVLDKKVKQIRENNLPVYVPQKGLPKVDAVIVTAVYYFDDIKDALSEMGFENVISLRTLFENNDLGS